jgi:myo-inositol-1(or 4)-monophosphatase
VASDSLSGFDHRLRVAREGAIEAGQLLVGFLQRPIRSRFKRGDSMVSEADHAAEELLRARIHDAFPEDSILGEEGGFDARDPLWCWTLDPLDGTQNFLAGVPLFSVALSVLHQREPAVAVVHDPIRGEVFSAVRGRGSRRDGVAIQVSSDSLGPSSLIAVRHRFLRRDADRIYDLLPTRKYRSLGSMCLELAYVAAGAIDVLVANRPHLWDIAPGSLLVEEAGGAVRSFDGSRIFPLPDEPGSIPDHRYRIAAGNPAVVEEVVRHLSALPL